MTGGEREEPESAVAVDVDVAALEGSAGRQLVSAWGGCASARAIQGSPGHSARCLSSARVLLPTVPAQRAVSRSAAEPVATSAANKRPRVCPKAVRPVAPSLQTAGSLRLAGVVRAAGVLVVAPRARRMPEPAV